MSGPRFGFVKLLASSGSHCTKWADEQHRPAGFESRLVPELPLPCIPTLIGLRAFDHVSSRVWWEAATNKQSCELYSPDLGPRDYFLFLQNSVFLLIKNQSIGRTLLHSFYVSASKCKSSVLNTHHVWISQRFRWWNLNLMLLCKRELVNADFEHVWKHSFQVCLSEFPFSWIILDCIW